MPRPDWAPDALVALPRAGRAAKPAGGGACGCRSRARVSGRARARGRRGRRGRPRSARRSGIFSADSSRAAPAAARRCSSAPTSTRFRRRRRSSRSSARTVSCATRPARSSAPTTSPRSRRCSRRSRGWSRMGARTRASSCSSRRRRRSGSWAPAAFDESRLAARLGYVYDHAGPIGEVILGAPYQRKLDARFRGRAAHAGMYPEEGRSAIAAAARAIADLRLGRIDAETSANVGGDPGRDRPQRRSRAVLVRGRGSKPRRAEARRRRSRRWWTRSRSPPGSANARSRSRWGTRPRATASSRTTSRCSSRRPRCGEPAASRAYILSGGGADANVFNERGLQCVNLANGMTDIHTPDERIAVADLEEMVEVTLALVDVAREVEHAA